MKLFLIIFPIFLIIIILSKLTHTLVFSRTQRIKKGAPMILPMDFFSTLLLAVFFWNLLLVIVVSPSFEWPVVTFSALLLIWWWKKNTGEEN